MRHNHTGHFHFHASVDHLANEYAVGARLLAEIDPELMRHHGVAADDIVRVAPSADAACCFE